MRLASLRTIANSFKLGGPRPVLRNSGGKQYAILDKSEAGVTQLTSNVRREESVGNRVETLASVR